MVEIIENKENLLLRRKQILAKVKVKDRTISRKEARELLKKEFDVDDKLIIIKKITPLFGSNEVHVEANIYEDEKFLKKNARPYLIKRNFPEEKKEDKE